VRPSAVDRQPVIERPPVAERRPVLGVPQAAETTGSHLLMERRSPAVRRVVLPPTASVEAQPAEQAPVEQPVAHAPAEVSPAEETAQVPPIRPDAPEVFMPAPAAPEAAPQRAAQVPHPAGPVTHQTFVPDTSPAPSVWHPVLPEDEAPTVVGADEAPSSVRPFAPVQAQAPGGVVEEAPARAFVPAGTTPQPGAAIGTVTVPADGASVPTRRPVAETVEAEPMSVPRWGSVGAQGWASTEAEASDVAEDEAEEELPTHSYTWGHVIVLVVVAFVLGMLIFMLLLKDSGEGAAQAAAFGDVVAGLLTDVGRVA